MKKYLNINNSCQIIYGINGAVLYDFNASKQYEVLQMESNILLNLQKGISIDDLYLKYESDTLNNFIADMEKTNVGYIANSFIPIEPYRIGNLKISDIRKSYTINKAYIELPTTCDKGCSYCTIPKINGCYSCSIPENEENKDIHFYTSLIDKICFYNCSNIIIHGGDPLNDWNFTKMVLDYILCKRTNTQNIFIITNDSSLDNTVLNYLLKNKINIILNTEYYIDYDLSEFLNEYDKLMNLDINVIFNFNVKYDFIENFKIFYSNLLNNYDDICYSIYSEEKSFNIKYIFDLPNNLINANYFSTLDSSHPCLFGTISIRSSGNVYPCIAFNNNALLNLYESTLDDLFFMKNKLFEFWNISLNELEKCSNCKFRKSCSDCRAFELSRDKNIKSKSSCSVI